MKKLIFISLTIILLLQSCKGQKDLYLYFDNNSKFMNKVRMGENEPYNYGFDFNNNTELNFSSDLLLLNSKEINLIDTLSLKKIKLRDYKWLNKFVNKYKHPDYISFSKLYKDVYIVEIDSINKKVIISKVESVIYEY